MVESDSGESILPNDLTDRTALVSGASGNLGSAIACRLARAGARTIVHYHQNREGAERVATQIKRDRGDARLCQADLSDAEAVAGLFTELAASDWSPDIVVNNAARQPVELLATMDIKQWHKVIAANLDAAFMVMQQATIYMRTRKAGCIVNIASIEATDPAPGHAHYSVSKAGLLMLTKAAAAEFGPNGIRVNSVSPGLLFRDGIEAQWPEGVSRWCSKAPLQKLGEVDDIAEAVLFLVGPAAKWITGTNLVVDGGMSTVTRW